MPPKPRFLPIVLATVLAVAAPLFAESGPVTRSQVLDAIRVFDANATGSISAAHVSGPADTVTSASNTILQYVLQSDDVVVDLGIDAVPWCDLHKGIADLPHSGDRGLLLAAYLSGSVKAQLDSGKLDPNPYDGWVAMLRVYRVVKMRESVTIPEVEGLLERQMNGSLRSYATTALARSNEKLHKAYGDTKPEASAMASQP